MDINEYIIDGISHYKKEQLSLNVANPAKSTKYQYNQGAIDALTNMLNFLRLTSKKSFSVTEKDNQTMIIFNATIPTNFDYKEQVYRDVISNECPVVVRNDTYYERIGTCKTGIVGKILYLQGQIKEEYANDSYNHMELKVDPVIGIIYELSHGSKNVQIVGKE